MKRSGPLKRKTPLKKKRARPRKGRVLDREHLDSLTELQCVVSCTYDDCCPIPFFAPPDIGNCFGRVDPHHHTGKRGLSQTNHDHRAFPLCRRHHDQFHDHRGIFEGWTREMRRAWQDRMVELYKPVDDVF